MPDAPRLAAYFAERAGGKIALQVLHAGRYSKQPGLVAPSAIRARINKFVPRPLQEHDIRELIESYRRCAAPAREGGYDGIEIMGSEGYLINTGIGWHEARVPTIATSVPRAAFTGLTAKLRPSVSIPVITSNRINMPQVAEEVLARGDADRVSMARPLLADPEWIRKAESGRAEDVNICIGCTRPASTTSSPACR